MALRRNAASGGLGALRVAGDGAATSVPVTMYRTDNSQLGNVLGTMLGQGSQSGRVCQTPVMSPDNGPLVRESVARALAQRTSGVTWQELLSGAKKVDAGAITTAERNSVRKLAAEKFFALAKQRGGRDARISTPVGEQNPRASYCTVDADH